jgi:hypothetical protein
VSEAGIELMILLPLPPECWDYTFGPPCPAQKSTLLNIKIYSFFMRNVGEEERLKKLYEDLIPTSFLTTF